MPAEAKKTAPVHGGESTVTTAPKGAKAPAMGSSEAETPEMVTKAPTAPTAPPMPSTEAETPAMVTPAPKAPPGLPPPPPLTPTKVTVRCMGLGSVVWHGEPPELRDNIIKRLNDRGRILRHTVDGMGVTWAEFATKEQGKRAVAKINGQTALGQYKLTVELVEDGRWPAMPTFVHPVRRDDRRERTQGGQRHKKHKCI